jgi:hypothetical protein
MATLGSVEPPAARGVRYRLRKAAIRSVERLSAVDSDYPLLDSGFPPWEVAIGAG